MRHEQAVEAALAGGPVPAEVALHLRECPHCRSELEALRALEGELREAAPPARGAGWEEDLVRRMALRPSDRGRTALRLAAALLLACALVAGLFAAGTWRPNGAGAVLQTEAQAGEAGPTDRDLATYLQAGSDSTSALLELAGPVADKMLQEPPPSLSDYIGVTDSGGWNG